MTGPFLPGLASVLIAINYLSNSILKKSFNFLKNKIIILLLIFNLYIILRSFFVKDIFLSLESSLFFFRYIFFALGITLIINNYDKKKIFDLLIIILTLIYSFFLIDSSYQAYFNKNIFNIVPIVDGRNTSIFGDEMILGNYIVRLSPIFMCLVFIKYKTTNLSFYFNTLIVIIALILSILSGERVSVFFALSLFLFHFFCFKEFLKIKFFLVPIIFLSVFFTIKFNDNVNDRILKTTINDFLSTNEKYYSFSRYHYSHYVTSYRMFLDNPLFGKGPRQFRKLCEKNKFKYDRYSCSTHPHNTYIQLLAETGIVGFMFFISLFFYFFYKLLINIFKHFFYNYDYSYKIYIYFGFFIWLWPLAPSFNFFGSWINIINYMYLGFLFIDKKELV